MFEVDKCVVKRNVYAMYELQLVKTIMPISV
jgi:hypothetical protein